MIAVGTGFSLLVVTGNCEVIEDLWAFFSNTDHIHAHLLPAGINRGVMEGGSRGGADPN